MGVPWHTGSYFIVEIVRQKLAQQTDQPPFNCTGVMVPPHDSEEGWEVAKGGQGGFRMAAREAPVTNCR